MFTIIDYCECIIPKQAPSTTKESNRNKDKQNFCKYQAHRQIPIKPVSLDIAGPTVSQSMAVDNDNYVADRTEQNKT